MGDCRRLTCDSGLGLLSNPITELVQQDPADTTVPQLAQHRWAEAHFRLTCLRLNRKAFRMKCSQRVWKLEAWVFICAKSSRSKGCRWRMGRMGAADSHHQLPPHQPAGCQSPFLKRCVTLPPSPCTNDSTVGPAFQLLPKTITSENLLLAWALAHEFLPLWSWVYLLCSVTAARQ